MSLSEHEKTEFERITAGLSLGDPAVLKKMTKRERATAMSHFAIPRISSHLALILHAVWVLLPLAAGITALFFAGIGNFVVAGAITVVTTLLLGAHFWLASRQ